MDNFIFKNSCLSADTCQTFINFIDVNANKATQGYLGDEPMDDIEIPINIYQQPDLRKGISDTFQKFGDRYPLLKTNFVPWVVDGNAQLMRYEPNNYCHKIHCESCGDERVFAWMIFLNTIKNGGGTEFIHQNVTAQPIAGDMYVWSAGWTHFHRGVVAPDERKYIITGWASNFEEYQKKHPTELRLSLSSASHKILT